MVRYLRVDHSEVVGNSHLSRLMWPDSVDQPIRLDLRAQFYAVPEDHANIAFIACLVEDHVWYTYPEGFRDTEPRQVRMFV